MRVLCLVRLAEVVSWADVGSCVARAVADGGMSGRAGVAVDDRADSPMASLDEAISRGVASD